MRREKFAEDMQGVEDSVGVLALVLQPVKVTLVCIVSRRFEHVSEEVLIKIILVINVVISLEHISAAVLHLAVSVALVYVVYGRIAL